jgi:thiamine biosynthesis lipoprotein
VLAPHAGIQHPRDVHRCSSRSRALHCRLALTCVIAALLTLAIGGGGPRPALGEQPRVGAHTIAWRTRTMGTIGQVMIVAADSQAVAPIAASALHVFAHVDSLMSNWTSTSEVARINREAKRGPIAIDSEVADVVALATRIGEQSGGAFDITVEPLVRLWGFLGGTPHVPQVERIDAVRSSVGLAHLQLDPHAATISFDGTNVAIDLGGIAKGYAADRALARLKLQGVQAALVDLSGNMASLGAPVGKSSWIVGVRDPRDRVQYFARLQLRQDAVATSGNYEQFVDAGGRRYGHVLDPRTGWPVQGLISATVLAPTAAEADAWATAMLVLGPSRARHVASEHPELHVVLVEPGDSALAADPAVPDTVWIERTLQDRISLESEASALFVIRDF